MTNNLIRSYKRFRRAGYSADHANSAAKTLAAWDDLEEQGLVRLIAEPDQDADIDNLCAYDEDTREGRACKKRLLEGLERDGAWGVVGQYRLSDQNPWKTGDSVWGFVVYHDVLSPTQNPYITGIMGETMRSLEHERVGVCQLVGANHIAEGMMS